MRNPETAKRLLEAMNKNKMTAKELSDKSSVSESSISQYLHGLFAPKNKTAAKLANVLHVNPMWLMGFDVPMEEPKINPDFIVNKLNGTDVSNANFVMDMDLISRDMTLVQMDSVLAFAKFIKAKKGGVSMWIEKTKTGLRLVDRIKVNEITKRIAVPLEKRTPQAIRRATERLLEKSRENTQPITEMRLKEAVEDYLSLKTDCKASTIIDLRNQFKNAYLLLGDPKLGELSAAMLRRAFFKAEKPPQTINRCIRAMRTFCSWCVDMEYLTENPMRNIKPLKEIKAEKNPEELYLEADKLQDLLDHLHDIPYYLTRFLALTGCRIGEALALLPEDIGDKYITINKSFYENSHQVTTPKNSSSIRQVFIQPELREMLNEFLHWRQIDIMAYGIRPKTLFYAHTGGYYRERYYRLLLHPHGVHPHMLRHTHVALLAEQGMSLEAIARRLGHDGTQTTKKVYYHVTEKQKQKDEEKMASIRIL